MMHRQTQIKFLWNIVSRCVFQPSMKKRLNMLSQTHKNESRIPKSDGFLHPLIQDCVCFLNLIYYLTNLPIPVAARSKA